MTMSAWQDRHYVSADGLRLYYRDYPSPVTGRRPVLCLPGLTRNSRDFEALALRLQPQQRVLSPDLRGRGCSQYDPQWRNYHPGTYLGDISALLADAGTERVVIIGTSLGGILGMLVAATQPRLLAGLVLNDIGPEVDGEGRRRIAGYVGRNTAASSWAEAAARTRDVNGLAFPELDDAQWLAFARRTWIEADGEIRLDMDPMIGEAIRAAPTGTAPDLWPAFAALGRLPMLAIRGAASDLLSEATFERMQREKPDLRRLTVPGRGHAPMLDEPGCVEAIDAFLAAVDQDRL